MIHLEEDLTEIGKLVWQYFDDKYITVIKEEVAEYQAICETHLGKEAYLIQSIMPFLPNEKQILDGLMQIMLYSSIIDLATMKHPELKALYKDENPERERFKRLVFKMIIMKLLMMLKELDH